MEEFRWCWMSMRLLRRDKSVLMMVSLWRKPFERQYIPVLIFAIDTIRAEAKKTGTLERNDAISVLRFCDRLNLTRKFWKTVMPLFSDKIHPSSKITLLKNEVLVTNDKEVAKILSECFVNITDSLGIIQPKDALTPTDCNWKVQLTSKYKTDIYKHKSIQWCCL